MSLTSLRKKSECFFSEARFTNSLNVSVLWIKKCSWEQRRSTDLSFCLCVRDSSLVHKVFVKEVHLWHSGYVNLHFLVSPFLSKIFSCPLLQAWSETRASQHCWSALEKSHYNLAAPQERLYSSPNLHTLSDGEIKAFFRLEWSYE